MLPVNPQFAKVLREDTFPVTLTPKKLGLIEKSACLAPGEKVMLVAIFAGIKWITDIAIARPDDINAALRLMNRLELPHRKDEVIYPDERVMWIQVTATKSILDYITSRRNDLTTLEAGILYGYAPSHVLAYMQGLPRRSKKRERSVAGFYFSGVFSDPYHDQEVAWTQYQWECVKHISPTIAAEAENFYKQHTT